MEPVCVGWWCAWWPRDTSTEEGSREMGEARSKDKPSAWLVPIYVTKPSLGKCAVRLEKKKAPERMFYYARAGS